MSGAAAARVIDVHAHVVLAETMGIAGSLGPEMGGQDGPEPLFRVGGYRLDGVRYKGSPFMDAKLRLARMAAAGIDFQVLSPNPLTFLHFAGIDLAGRFCRVHNDALAALIREHHAGLAALPVQDVGAAVEELERAVGELGLLGACIGTDLPRPLDSPEMDALYAACVRLDVPLFIHPAPAGIDGPPGDANLGASDLDVVIGFAAQETLAVARLIYGGVPDRHPELDICLSHGGGASAFLVGRMAQAVRKRPWAPAELRADGAFEERLARLWFDTHLNNGPIAGSADGAGGQ
ncbi:MAG: amidohydrolase family protein [Pararhodobacter sp.]|nr:amidohydrolase family protein [Pararhodobacter sp.]